MSPELRNEGDGLAVVAENPWAIAIRPRAETDNKKREIKRGKTISSKQDGQTEPIVIPCVRLTNSQRGCETEKPSAGVRMRDMSRNAKNAEMASGGRGSRFESMAMARRTRGMHAWYWCCHSSPRNVASILPRACASSGAARLRAKANWPLETR